MDKKHRILDTIDKVCSIIATLMVVFVALSLATGREEFGIVIIIMVSLFILLMGISQLVKYGDWW